MTSDDQTTIDQLQRKNHALAQALRAASKQLEQTKAQLEEFSNPPLTLATLIRVTRVNTDKLGVQHAQAQVVVGAREIIVHVAPQVRAASLHPGQCVVLNETMTLVDTRASAVHGSVRQVQQVCDDGRLIINDGSGNETIITRAQALANTTISNTDRVLVDSSMQFALEVLAPDDMQDLMLEETPDVTFDNIGGLDKQIERIRDAVQLPFHHRALFERYNLQPPKGVLLYGPPGNGKTLIAKAIANALAQGTSSSGVFLSVKGPELLTKYVGESERMIRLIFDRARELAQQGHPVIVFIDEMDSLLRTRGTGVSSDVETTIVPQFLTELDGIDSLENVIVIGASNRIDMIDPAVLRPGRLDMKIRIDRPNQIQAMAIIAHYLTDDLPLQDGCDAHTLASTIVHDVYQRDASREIAHACDEHGEWFALYLCDVISGAMLKNIVDRAKTKAVKASIEHGQDVTLSIDLMSNAVQDELKETRESIRDVDAGQWSKINGVDAGLLTAIRAV